MFFQIVVQAISAEIELNSFFQLVWIAIGLQEVSIIWEYIVDTVPLVLLVLYNWFVRSCFRSSEFYGTLYAFKIERSCK